MTSVLFEMQEPERKLQLCDSCPAAALLSDDGLRVLGWWVFDGESETHQPLRVRRCPRCQRLPAEEQSG